MSDSPTFDGASGKTPDGSQDGQSAYAGARHVLEFEKPLAQIDRQIHELEALQQQKQVDYAKELRQLRNNYTSLLRKTYDNLTAWETVQVARHPQRPQMRDYIDMICPEFREIHGDRRYGDDPAVVCGLARLGGQKIVLIGHHKGRDTKEKIKCFFGLAHPEGYRKALRSMKLAEKFGLPVVTLIDTPGAYPGIGAEERGQAESIARNMMEMSRLKTPIVSVVIGEGGSGGALAMGVGNRIYMLENAVYSVISPESCAAIIYRDAGKAPQAAAAMKMTAPDLLELGLIDGIVPEPGEGAHSDPDNAAEAVGLVLREALRELAGMSSQQLIDERYDKFRNMGAFFTETVAVPGEER
jgi:acetyl-CoA carboxylase carboxyl transferase subunit alpha